MNKLYASIETDLVDPDLEAKIDTEVQAEPQFQDVPNDLYAAITTNAPEASGEVSPISPEAKQYSYVVPNRLYTQLVPEKPSILAEERIFVYVPKVSYGTAGIAKFATNQFNIVNGEVSIKQTYLSEMLSSNLIKPDLILVVDVLPAVGLENRIYIVPLDLTTSNGYIWNALLNSWVSLGTMALNLTDYYTKLQVQALLGEVSRSLPLYDSVEDAMAANIPENTVVLIKIN